MAEKSNVEVIIGGKVYTLSGYDGEEYLQKIAAYVNSKINEYESIESLKRLPPDTRATLVQLNIADDYLKAKMQLEKLESEKEAKEKEIYDLRHELSSRKIKEESDASRIKELEAENKELLMDKTRLETALEEGDTARIKKLEAENRELLMNKTRLETALEESLLGEIPASSKKKR